MEERAKLSRNVINSYVHTRAKARKLQYLHVKVNCCIIQSSLAFNLCYFSICICVF